MSSEHDDLPPEETDDRFPSGPWTGFWIQGPIKGKQDLILTFSGGSVRGEGYDMSGDFLVRGTYDVEAGRAALRKIYPGSHTVEYDATADGNGLWGPWQINIPATRDHPGFHDRGGFHIWPVTSGEGEGLREHAEAPIHAHAPFRGE